MSFPSRFIIKANFKLLWHHANEHMAIWITFIICILCVIVIPRYDTLYQYDDNYTLIMNLSYSYIAGFIFYFLNEFVSDLQTRIFSYEMIKRSLAMLSTEVGFVMPTAILKGVEPYKYKSFEEFYEEVPTEWKRGKIAMTEDDYFIFNENLKDINKDISVLCNVFSRYLKLDTIEILTNLQREVNNYTHKKGKDRHVVKYDCSQELLKRLYYAQWYFLKNFSYYDLH